MSTELLTSAVPLSKYEQTAKDCHTCEENLITREQNNRKKSNMEETDCVGRRNLHHNYWHLQGTGSVLLGPNQGLK